AAHAPAQAAVVAAVPSPEGVLLVLESHAPARAGAAAGWSIVQVDANGGVAARSTVAQRAPQVVAAGHTSAAIWAQARGQGLVVERAMGPGAVAEATAPWPSPETPLALAVDDSEQWWAISAAAHPAHDVWTVLATRFGKHEDAEPAARDAACTAKWTLRAPVRQVADGLTDGTPCGPDATCLAGQCRPAGR
ncbi:MAG: hypothetical protein FJ100_06555, partial [Deltaproteobacteria bacterium]|nr:hypothetical protein [Deltaproteobacteria bacterium]